jgi:hypothetical protein
MPVLRERMHVSPDPVMRLTCGDPAEDADAPRPDAMAAESEWTLDACRVSRRAEPLALGPIGSATGALENAR